MKIDTMSTISIAQPVYTVESTHVKCAIVWLIMAAHQLAVVLTWGWSHLRGDCRLTAIIGAIILDWVHVDGIRVSNRSPWHLFFK